MTIIWLIFFFKFEKLSSPKKCRHKMRGIAESDLKSLECLGYLVLSCRESELIWKPPDWDLYILMSNRQIICANSTRQYDRFYSHYRMTSQVIAHPSTLPHLSEYDRVGGYTDQQPILTTVWVFDEQSLYLYWSDLLCLSVYSALQATILALRGEKPLNSVQIGLKNRSVKKSRTDL